MASVPKPAAVASTSPAPSARPVSSATRVASVSTSQVDALEAGTNISFDAAASGFDQDNPHSQLGDDRGSRRQRYTEPGVNRLFTSDSQSFASIFEGPEAKGRNDNENGGRRRFDAPVSKVITTYETNALIVSGEQPMRGTSLSFSL